MDAPWGVRAPADAGAYAVVAGGRRLAAMKALTEDGTIDADHPVPCLVAADPATAEELSLAENVVRIAMHPADQVVAFPRPRQQSPLGRGTEQLLYGAKEPRTGYRIGGGIRFDMEQVNYRLWLKLRTAKPLHSEETALTAMIAGRPVTIESEGGEQPLSKASWLVIGCRGFETEDLARQFGEALRKAVHLAALCTRVGIDAGDPGEDRSRSWVNPEAISPEFRRKYPELRFGPDVHGIVILPDDENTVFLKLSEPEAVVRSNAEHFLDALEQALPNDDMRPAGSPSIRRAVRILNLAEMNQDPIAKAVLAISTVEGLAVDPPWTDEQEKLIEEAANCLENACGDAEDAKQVIQAIRRVRKESIRQRIRKLLAVNGLSSLWQSWDRLYAKRSKLLHDRSAAGDESRGNHLEQAELHSFGHEAATLSTQIVLSIAKRSGMPVPDRAKTHFGVE